MAVGELIDEVLAKNDDVLLESLEGRRGLDEGVRFMQ